MILKEKGEVRQLNMDLINVYALYNTEDIKLVQAFSDYIHEQCGNQYIITPFTIMGTREFSLIQEESLLQLLFLII